MCREAFTGSPEPDEIPNSSPDALSERRTYRERTGARHEFFQSKFKARVRVETGYLRNRPEKILNGIGMIEAGPRDFADLIHQL